MKTVADAMGVAWSNLFLLGGLDGGRRSSIVSRHNFDQRHLWSLPEARVSLAYPPVVGTRALLGLQ